ncbi:ribbon-helix-helix protein, CopG family [Streptomyces himalayensis]|uniref:Ribbon-helix-helix protein, CopG family n=1 Tax=Streptomyces himalayensis subsp. himalayensis TaxID=2756131 RepID=A0A7W0DRK8_9ACTN|nr:ribbon-helix-helix protein, CopG family [Streptomyces himalayensis]MBA2949483.1 ribbon-helix-helix protein, CopG family [Streptomyces himalayensis subsp. himalayensis]
MTMKRTMVYADADDMAVIKQAAARQGISEAEIIREALHLAALRYRRRERPLGLRRFNRGDPTLADRADAIVRESMGSARTED